MDTRVPALVRIENASLDESTTSPAGMVVRGRVAPSTFRFLKVDKEYQRGLDDRADIHAAIKEGIVLPDIDIGVRGEDFSFDGNDCVIRSPAFIIDGWQRIGTALRVLDLIPDVEVRIGALVHFNTTQAWEAARFTQLNLSRKKVSANLHMRNLRADNHAVLTLYGVSTNQPGALKGRVCWEQAMKRDQLISAITLAKTAMVLHAHKTAVGGWTAPLVSAALKRAAENVSLSRFRHNVVTFFDVIDECWGLREIEYKTAATQIKGSFMMSLARLFSRHLNFWSADGSILQVDAAWRKKLAQFQIHDPYIRDLASSAGKAQTILYGLLCDHVNSGKRVNQLEPRRAGGEE